MLYLIEFYGCKDSWCIAHMHKYSYRVVFRMMPQVLAYETSYIPVFLFEKFQEKESVCLKITSSVSFLTYMIEFSACVYSLIPFSTSQVIVFERGDLVFVFNFHQVNTYEGYIIFYELNDLLNHGVISTFTYYGSICLIPSFVCYS